MKKMVIALLFLSLLGTACTSLLKQKFDTYGKAKEQAEKAAAEAEMRNLQTAQEAYFATYSKYASSINDLKEYGKFKSKVEFISADETGYEMKVFTEGKEYVIKKDESGVTITP